MSCDDGGWELTSLDSHLLVCRTALYLGREPELYTKVSFHVPLHVLGSPHPVDVRTSILFYLVDREVPSLTPGLAARELSTSPL